jgi:hypothetical protein
MTTTKEEYLGAVLKKPEPGTHGEILIDLGSAEFAERYRSMFPSIMYSMPGYQRAYTLSDLEDGNPPEP